MNKTLHRCTFYIFCAFRREETTLFVVVVVVVVDEVFRPRFQARRWNNSKVVQDIPSLH